jgi:hypothetical protein
MQSLRLRAVQFLSRPFSREDWGVPKASFTTREGRRLDGYLKIEFGTPLLVGAAPNTKVRPNYAHPWQPQDDRPSIGAVQWIDPYADLHWPSWALVSFSANIAETALDTAAQCDILQRMRTVVSFEIFDLPELKALTDQLLAQDGYRYGYWSPDLDFVRNPVPAPGKFHNADRGEPVGPGHASLFGVGFGKDTQINSLALVWSQAFSFPNRTNAQADDAAIRERGKVLKRHYNSRDELTQAEEYLQQCDVKGCTRSAASAVEAALRFYCAEWNVPFPTARIPFDQKIECILQQAGRPTEAWMPGACATFCNSTWRETRSTKVTVFTKTTSSAPTSTATSRTRAASSPRPELSRTGSTRRPDAGRPNTLMCSR